MGKGRSPTYRIEKMECAYAILVKRIVEILLSRFPDKFSLDFAENKKMVSELTDIESKKIIAQVAGKISRVKKLQQQQ